MIKDYVKSWIRTELFDLVPINICVIDSRLHIVEANRTFKDTYGPDWLNRPCYEVYKGRTDRCSRCAAVLTFQDGKIRKREEKGIIIDGQQIYYMVQMVPLIGPEGEIPYVLEMSTDITELKKLEQDKLSAERLATVGQTVAGLAHGVKNIIMGLEGGMYVVNSGIMRNDGERIIQGWKMLEEDIKRISSFVKEFLDFAKGRESKVVVVDPNRIAKKVYDLFFKKAEMEGIELRIDLQENIEPAALDEEGIHTCLVNLVSNAIDACEMCHKNNLHVTISTRDENGKLIYEVTDDGLGMDYDIKQKVFTNFFSTKSSGRGTGLGLLTTRKIIQEHGGTVSFDSTEGKGSVFRLELPRERLPKVAPEKNDVNSEENYVK